MVTYRLASLEANPKRQLAAEQCLVLLLCCTKSPGPVRPSEASLPFIAGRTVGARHPGES